MVEVLCDVHVRVGVRVCMHKCVLGASTHRFPISSLSRGNRILNPYRKLGIVDIMGPQSEVKLGALLWERRQGRCWE